MNILLIPIIKEAIERLLDRIPDPNERAKEKAKIEAEIVNATLEVQKGQIEINKEEAKHSSIFVAGWRPFIGWIGGVGLAWTFILKPVLMFAFLTLGIAVPSPDLIAPEYLMELVFALLGFGTLRTFEKWKGVVK